MPGKLQGTVALISGAGRGIGKAVALAYAREGAQLALCSRSAEGAATAAAAKKLGAGVLFQRCDVSDAKKAAGFVATTVKRFKRLDVLVNNAGLLGPMLALEDYPPKEWRKVMQTNVDGILFLSQAAVRLAMRRQGSGSIINVTSGLGRFGRALGGAYSVSKFGVEGLTMVLADEVKARGIRVNALNPGPTRTKMRAEYAPKEDPMSLKTPEAVIPAFVYLASAESAGVTGQTFDIDPQTGAAIPPRGMRVFHAVR